MVGGEHDAVRAELEQHADERGSVVVAAHGHTEVLAQDLRREPLASTGAPADAQRRMRGPPGQPGGRAAPRNSLCASQTRPNTARPTGAIAIAKMPTAIATLRRTAPNTTAISGGSAASAHQAA